jgi:hypothetical protein
VLLKIIEVDVWDSAFAPACWRHDRQESVTYNKPVVSNQLLVAAYMYGARVILGIPVTVNTI